MSELAVRQEGSDVHVLARGFASRLKYMLVNGNRLHDNEIFALAQYAASTGLDPFAGECWIIPGKGVCPGIAGWRKKAQEQLDYEVRESNMNTGAHYWMTFEDATPGECVFDPAKGDIAYKAILRDFITQTRWRKAILETAGEFNKMGLSFDQAIGQAKEMVGEEPLWVGYGVVFGNESFGGNEKFDRKERAKKRAEKVALRKRFPRLHLPEPAGNEDVVEVDDYNIMMDDESPKLSDKQALIELGFESDTSPENELEPSPEPTKATAPEKMTVEFAATVKSNTDGKLYGDLTADELTEKKIGLMRLRKSAPDKWTDEHQVKLDAAITLLAARGNAA